MDLYYLIYTSSPTRVLSANETEDLLATCRKQNEIHSVTGMLLCFTRMYIQLIEGPEEEIRRLYENIKQDSRHSRITTLKQGPISQRFFPGWSMGYDKSDLPLRNTKGSFDLKEPQSLQLLEILGDLPDW